MAGPLPTESIRDVSLVRRRRPPVPAYGRPLVRRQCAEFARPCPFVSCRYNLSIDVTPVGSIRYRMGVDWADLRNSPSNCALDHAAEGSSTLEKVASLLNCSRTRISQEEDAALAKLRAAGLQLPSHGSLTEIEYDRAPEITDMRALGLPEDDPWIRKIWRLQTAMSDETP